MTMLKKHYIKGPFNPSLLSGNTESAYWKFGREKIFANNFSNADSIALFELLRKM
jgi:hypothetical protein